MPVPETRSVVVQRAKDVLQLVEEQASPPQVIATVRLFATYAPEVLALGPVPATFAARMLHGLCSERKDIRGGFLFLVQRESTPPASPVISGMRKAGLLTPGDDAKLDISPEGRALHLQLVLVGALPKT